jgi:tetratricopeptide (TPR) repeat protein
MAAVKTDTNPFIRRSPLKRAWDVVKTAPQWPKWGYQAFRGWSRPLQYLLIGLIAISAVGGGIAGYNWYERRSRNIAINQEWIGITNDLRVTGDKEKILAGLSRILELDPSHYDAARFKQALETGKCHPADSEIVKVVIRDHLKENRIDDAERELKRRLEYEPRDYFAHTQLTNIYQFRLGKLNQDRAAAIEKGDKQAVQQIQPSFDAALQDFNRELDALAQPNTNSVNLDFISMSTAIESLRSANKNPNQIRQLIADRALPLLKNDAYEKSEPYFQFLLLFLYSEVFELPTLPQDALNYWPAASRMMNLCLDGVVEKGDITTAGRIANLGPKYAAALIRLHSTHQITEPNRVDLSHELEERVRRGWMIVLAADPKNPQAHVGLVESYFRDGKNAEGITALLKAIETVGDQPQLLQMFTNLAIFSKREMGAYERLKQAAERNPKQPIYWRLAAQAAMAADRRDLANTMLEEASTRQPDDPSIALMQAALFNGTGHPELVIKALRNFPDEAWLRTPQGTMVLARALAEIGDTERLDAFLKGAADLGDKASRPEPAAYAAQGIFDAEPPSAERAKIIADFLGGVVEKHRATFPAVVILHALALARSAELSDGSIDSVRAATALVALERALALDPNHVGMNIARIRLHLYGTREPLKAYFEIEPLKARMEKGDLKPAELAIIGAVCNANKKHDEAIRVLNNPYTLSKATAGCWVQLGIAYSGQGRTAEAIDALDRASYLTMSDRERAEYNTARVLLSQREPK